MKSKDLSPSEIYAIQFQNEEPSHYTRIPQILKQLTYDYVNPKTGKKSVKRLSVHARVLYEVLKSTAGDCGFCWKNRNLLAQECNMSAGSITKAKEELTQSFHQLDGNPLIIIEEKQKNNLKGKKSSGKTPYHQITICNIWKWNRAYLSIEKNLKTEALSPDDRAGEALSPDDRATKEARSPHDTNKIPYNKISLSKEQQPTPKGVPVGFSDKKRMSPSDGYTPDQENLALYFLENLGFREKVARKLIHQYTYEELQSASHYCKQIADKKRVKGLKFNDPCGYYINCLQNKYWEKIKDGKTGNIRNNKR